MQQEMQSSPCPARWTPARRDKVRVPALQCKPQSTADASAATDAHQGQVYTEPPPSAACRQPPDRG